MTQRLYYSDSHISEFTATVTSCTPKNGVWEVILDQTAFFPGGGGQEPDSGLIGGVAAKGAGETGEDVLHLTEAPLSVGETVKCSIDWNARFDRMQQHSGEHILSGILHSLYGVENVGFHMGEEDVVVDFSAWLTPEQLEDAAMRVNRAIWENVPVTQSYPAPEELDALTYRSKLDLRENVRIVTVEGYDTCACCAPHVKRTGEVGLLILLGSSKLRGGVRVHMLAGRLALEKLLRRSEQTRLISNLFSVPPEDTAAAAAKYAASHEALVYDHVALRRKLLQETLSSLTSTEGNLLLFEQALPTADLRDAVNHMVTLANGISAAFSGSDDTGYSYVMGANTDLLSRKAKEINVPLQGRGGGRGSRIEGSLKASREEIEAFFADYRLDREANK